MEPEFKAGDPAPWPLPSFVRCIEHVDLASGLPFDCWSPEATGHPAIDYEAGRQYCAYTLNLARKNDSPTFLINVLVAMRRRFIDQMEIGFLCALAEKAAVGACPPDFPACQIFQPDGEFRNAERIADAYLRVAREPEGWTTIVSLLFDFMDGELEEPVGAYLFKVCRAAMNGTLS